jgi:hypothetical protein
MHKAGKFSRGIAPVLPTHASPSQLVQVSAGSGSKSIFYLPNTSGQVDLLKERKLRDKVLCLCISSGPVAGAIGPRRRVMGWRRS